SVVFAMMASKKGNGPISVCQSGHLGQADHLIKPPKASASGGFVQYCLKLLNRLTGRMTQLTCGDTIQREFRSFAGAVEAHGSTREALQPWLRAPTNRTKRGRIVERWFS
ncbi:hypothetical protein QCE47_24980, partial [Caballeronia sp. LZ025]|uniref:hypothetical protein n=1 Tax=Caballeronia sp. LZ025 TaxID=3038562 RepID=UPI00286298FA